MNSVIGCHFVNIFIRKNHIVTAKDVADLPAPLRSSYNLHKMSNSAEPKELGTLIVVVGKAVGCFQKPHCWCRNCLTYPVEKPTQQVSFRQTRSVLYCPCRRGKAKNKSY